jgi:putative ABC transport system permease protein
VDTIISVFSQSLELGFLYSLVVVGLVVAFRITGFIDLTMESSFTTGAAISVISICNGINPLFSLILGSVCGAIAGFCTGILHTKTGISKLLSGIIMMTILYSLNLRIMGKPNYSLGDQATVFNPFQSITIKILFILIIVSLLILLLWWLLKTDFGLSLRAVGENLKVIIKTGSNPNVFIVSGLMLSNAIIALAGGVIAQNNGYADINMGTGIIISTLAALMIGESILPPTNVLRLLICTVVGSIVYQLIIVIGLRLGINPGDLKLATGVLLAIAIFTKNFWSKESVNNIGNQSL